MDEKEREQDEDLRAQAAADHAEVMAEIDADYFNRPGRGGWAPADFEYECPAARRSP